MLQDAAGTRSAVIRHDHQDNRRQHEEHGCRGGCFGEHRRRAARAEDGLRTHTAKCAGQIGRLTALQKDHNNHEKTDDDVDRGDQVQHAGYLSIAV